MAELMFRRNCGPDDWSPLPHRFEAGDIVYRYPGYDYGCSADDLRLGGVRTVACCEREDEGPFFTVPINWLEARP